MSAVVINILSPIEQNALVGKDAPPGREAKRRGGASLLKFRRNSMPFISKLNHE